MGLWHLAGTIRGGRLPLDQGSAQESVRGVPREDEVLQATAELLHAIEATLRRPPLEQAEPAIGPRRLPPD